MVSYHILPSIAVSSGTTLFNIPSGSDAGSCDSEDIDGIISEAAKMVTAAITAITNYQSASLLSAPSQAVLNTYETAFAMFGAEGTKLPLVNRVSISSSGNAILTNVKSEYRQRYRARSFTLIFFKTANYQKVLALLNSATNIGPSNKAVLACDETFLKWVVTLEDMSPGLKGTAEGQTTVASQLNKQNPLVSGKLCS